jgi:MoxR-like ATPase
MVIQVVGRRRELELVRAALASGAHILLEGPPGSGKSTLLRQVAASRHTEFVLVEGSAELTPARLIGSFDPALVLEQGHRVRAARSHDHGHRRAPAGGRDPARRADRA